MDWTTLFFSFRGRINRGRYWLVVLTFLLAWAIYLLGLLMWLGDLNTDSFPTITGKAVGLMLIGAILAFLAMWSGLAAGVKRLHDREKSGWWILLFWLGPSIAGFGGDTTSGSVSWVFTIASLALAIWGMVELGFLRGTDGPNDYGPDTHAPQTTYS